MACIPNPLQTISIPNVELIEKKTYFFFATDTYDMLKLKHKKYDAKMENPELKSQQLLR